jgi:27-O-demethylrifamycin SV methyltransferase
VGIERANEKVSETEVGSQVDFLVCDAMNMQFEGAAFDVAWVMESSHLMPDKARLVSECFRVLKPGGRVVLCDLMFQRYPSAREILDRRDQLLALERAFGKARLDTLSHYHDLFAEAGLEDVETEDVSALVTPTIDHWEKNIRAHRERLRGLFNDEQTNTFLASCEILKDLYATAGWGYGIICGTKRAIES